MKIIIRDAKKDDLPKIAEMSFALAKYESKFNKNTNLKNRYNSALAWHKKKFGKIKMILVEVNGKIVGFATAWVDKHDKKFFKNYTGYLCEIFIKENYRKKGIGKKLVNEITKWAKSNKLKKLSLIVYCKNPSFEFYNKLGFTPLETKLWKRI